MNYYAAKFKREKMEKPTDWLILPCGSGFALVKTKLPEDGEQVVEDIDFLRNNDYGMMP